MYTELTTLVSFPRAVCFGSEHPGGMEEWTPGTPKLWEVNHRWHCCPESTVLAQLLGRETLLIPVPGLELCFKAALCMGGS